jgi:hypothetical protein
MCIFVGKLRFHFPDIKHLIRGFVCHEIFGNFFRHSDIFGLHPQLYILATALLEMLSLKCNFFEDFTAIHWCLIVVWFAIARKFMQMIVFYS